jgi:glycosyltransferase involved in cell wall biosynthesis
VTALRDVAFVHDYLTQRGGAERVAGQIAALLPNASLFTTVHDRREVPLSFVGGRPWQTSFLQPLALRLPLKLLLPLLPSAAASLDVRGSETVISSSSAFAHHVRKARGARHICYCCTPAHFLWQRDEYFRARPALRQALTPLLALLERLDLKAAGDVDAYIAVSRHVAGRIRDIYGREASVLYPPVEIARFAPSRERSGRFLVVSRLVRPKRVELVIEAANRHALPLDVVGKGPELEALRRLAGPTVKVHGWQTDETVRRAMAECTAVIVAGEEDFGLVAAEAQASGRPPVAFARGGSLEIVEDGTTGFLFDEQTPEAIAAAMQRAASSAIDVASLRDSAGRFELAGFGQRFESAIDAARKRCVSAAASVSVQG